ncbi:MAG: hypothetical protein M0Z61_17445 [Nitrospiraceae bacterium]|nr:hypothetical protein [Nitrospiraceae bacterium]
MSETAERAVAGLWRGGRLPYSCEPHGTNLNLIEARRGPTEANTTREKNRGQTGIAK